MIESVGGFGSVLDAVRNAQGAERVTPQRAAASAPGDSFSDMLAQAAGQTVDTLKGAEFASLQSIRGKASVQQVVDAVMAAEQALQAAIAVRDKMVGAYQELTRMQI